MSETKAQLKQQMKAYDLSVERCLVEFYNQTPESAKTIVKSWQRRMKNMSVPSTGLYMHAEAINTAANLLGVEVAETKRADWKKYLKLLDDCWEQSLKKVSRASKTSSI